MSVKAIARGVRISPRKVGVVAALVRGRSVADALVILEHTPRHEAAKAVSKVVASARANADRNHGYQPTTLQVTSISVTPGPSIKRMRPVAMGRGLPFKRRSCHIRVEVDGEKRAPKKPSIQKGTA